MTYMSFRLVGLASVPPGWQAVYALDPGDHVPDLDTASDSDLMLALPVAALAHVEEWERNDLDHEDPGNWHDDVATKIVPITSGEAGWYEDDNLLGLLGPGEQVDVWRKNALTYLKSQRRRLEEVRQVIAQASNDAQEGRPPNVPSRHKDLYLRSYNDMLKHEASPST